MLPNSIKLPTELANKKELRLFINKSKKVLWMKLAGNFI